MTASAAYLALGGVVTIAFGAAYVVRSRQMARLVGIEMPSASARADYRAIYSGSQIGIGLFFIIASRHPSWFAPGLTGLALFALGFGIARLASLASERAGREFQWLVGALEMLAGLVALWLLAVLRAS